ncbi:MAG: twin-arginine translocase TatA/TatE family subunit [Chloroflexi bacterium]|nr:twin-arginine translocase TatA/TatE family subunit [Chloroflexota bacterium]
MFRSFGPLEIILVLGLVLLLFGASRLPQMGHSLGKGFREFKRGITGAVDAATADDSPELTETTKPTDSSASMH